MTELTERQQQVLALKASGLTAREIAVELHLSLRTINDASRAAMKELGATTPIQAVALAIRFGLI